MRSIRLLLLLAAATSTLAAQPLDEWAALVGDQYRVTPDIVYSTANGYENRLDVYALRDESAGPRPTAIYIHGGGWVGGTKEASTLRLLPYLAKGMAVVNVEYRLARSSLAPAAVADCRCALRWVYANAEQYGFDTSKIVVTGNSAGGHLALMTGMTDPAAGLDYECTAGAPDAPIGVAAIVNWYGITDVGDLLAGPNQKSYAVRWLGSLADREAVAERASPLTYVRKGLPPTLTIHGDADPTVPYSHATRLHAALDKAGVANELVTIPGGRHGGFPADQAKRAYAAINAFLHKHGVL